MQARTNPMTLQAHIERRTEKIQEAKVADMDKAACGLFSPKGEKIKEIWVSSGPRHLSVQWAGVGTACL